MDLSKENTANTAGKTDLSGQDGIFQRVLRKLDGRRLFGNLSKSNADEPSVDKAENPMNQQHNAQVSDEQTNTEPTETVTEDNDSGAIFGAMKDAWNQGANKIKGVVSDIGDTEAGADSGSIFALMKGVLSKGTNQLKDAVSSIGSAETAVNEVKNEAVDEVKINIDTPNDPPGQNQVAASVAENISDTVEEVISSGETELAKDKESADPLAIAGSVFGMMKNVFSKGVDTVKDTAAKIDLTGSAETAKNGLDKGTSAINEAATSPSDTDSVVGIAKNILSKGVDSIKETKAVFDSTESIADAAKSIFSRKHKDDLHRGVSETVEAGLQQTESVTKDAATSVVNAASKTAKVMENGMVEATDKIAHHLDEDRSISAQTVSPALKKVVATAPVEVAKTEEGVTDKITDVAEHIVTTATETLNHKKTMPAETVVGELSDRETAATKGMTADGVDALARAAKNTVEGAARDVEKAMDSAVKTPSYDGSRSASGSDGGRTGAALLKGAEETADAAVKTAKESVSTAGVNTGSKTVENTATEVVDELTAISKTTTDKTTDTDSIPKESKKVGNSLGAALSKSTTGVSDDAIQPSLERVEEGSAAIVDAAKDTTRKVDFNPVSRKVENNVDKVADAVMATPVVDIDTKRKGVDSTTDQSSTVTRLNAIDGASEVEKKTLEPEAEKLSKIGDVASSTAWTVENSAGAHANPFTVDKADDTVIADSASLDDDHLDVLAAPTEKSGFRWVLPVVLLSLLSVGLWWLSVSRTGQESIGTDFAMVEPTTVGEPEANSADLDAGVGGSSFAGSGATDIKNTASETSRLQNETETAQIQVIDSASSTDGEEVQEVIDISDGSGVESRVNERAIRSAPGSGSDTALGQVFTSPEMTEKSNDNSSGAEMVAMAQQTSRLSQMKTRSIVQNSMVGDPVESIKNYLESGDRTVPKRFILHGLNFRISSSRVSRDSGKIVSNLANMLRTYPNTKIRLEGHTDDRGNPDKNMALSASRAKAVKARLARLNVDPMRVEAVGLGKERPIADNETRTGQFRNRRVELVITDR